MNGIINLIKPPDMTSNDIVVYLRWLLGIKKIGHTGTLDPGASGVLPICLGKATRLFGYLVEKPKEYLAEIHLGIVTDTEDNHGTVLRRNEAHVRKTELSETLRRFTGDIMQTPPMYSAVRQSGRKLYEIARSGGKAQAAPRQTTIYRARLVRKTSESSWLIKIKCSKGTYIRTLCSDIGDSLGCGAHMSLLIRTASGPFLLEEAYTLEELRSLHESGCISKAVIPMDLPLTEMGEAVLPPSCREDITSGRQIAWGGPAEDGLLKVYCGQEFIGIGKAGAGVLRIKTLLI
ncbi:MAG: tRNA pseudouridine(55) synthase TruB [Bacillota bacterium]|nr:tRNA pseudouridine(55) synthase TruB [Bacillota bacterium]